MKCLKNSSLQNNFHFDGWQKDINKWLEDKQQIISTSVLEGCPCGVMEAMACGLRPLIHNFVGAKGIFPDEYVWSSIGEFIEKATKPFNKQASESYRDWVVNNHSFDDQIKKIKEIIK